MIFILLAFSTLTFLGPFRDYYRYQKGYIFTDSYLEEMQKNKMEKVRKSDTYNDNM